MIRPLPVILFICLFTVAFGIPSPALAYLDPGSGNLKLQLLLGGIAGILVLLKMNWARICNLFRRKEPEENHPPSSELDQ